MKGTLLIIIEVDKVFPALFIVILVMIIANIVWLWTVDVIHDRFDLFIMLLHQLFDNHHNFVHVSLLDIFGRVQL